LWTTVPTISLGLFAWAPAVHIARQRRTSDAWWWLATFVASTITEVVLVEVVPTDAGGVEGALPGVFLLAYLITASVYAWRGCGPRPAAPSMYPAAYVDAWHQPTHPGSAQPMPTPMPTHAAMHAPAPMPTPAPGYMPAPAPMPTAPPTMAASGAWPGTTPPADDNMAAEVQAELRELRGFLGGEDVR